jgi:hypothetical protein
VDRGFDARLTAIAFGSNPRVVGVIDSVGLDTL